MKRVLFAAALFCILTSGCGTTRDSLVSRYGMVEERVLNVRRCLEGMYHGNVPDTLTSDGLMSLLVDHHFVNERTVLEDYQVRFFPIHGQYLIIVYDHSRLVLFDYGATPSIDGAVYRGDVEYFVKNAPIGR